MSLGRFYGAVCSISSVDTQRMKTKWEEELATNIDDETWHDIWSYAKRISICARTREIQFKIIHRLHNFFNPSLSPMCLKYKTVVGTLTHCLWSCNRLHRYWFLVLGDMEKIFNMQLDFDPVSLVLGIPNKCIVLSANKKLYNILSFAARKSILLHWISDKSP